MGASPESLAGAPEATRERVALRCLEEVSAVVAAGDAAGTGKALRVDDDRSCEDLLLQLIGEVRCSYAPMCILAVRIRLPISLDSAEAAWTVECLHLFLFIFGDISSNG